MPNDPALVPDTSTFMEAVAGDGGTHNTAGVWWLSPDIQLIGSVSGPDKADPGVDNIVNVTLHSAGQNGSLPPGTESLSIELWVANPSLAMAPNNAASTRHIDSIGMQLLPNGGTETYQFHWVPPQGIAATDPEASGHKCLIARSYADPLIPSNMSFFAPEDRHVAQHNICIVPCGGPGAVRKPGACSQTVTTINPDFKGPQRTHLRAVFDQDPSRAIREIIAKRLKHVKGFARLSTKPPRGFRIEIPEFPKAKAVDKSKGGKTPSFDVDLVLNPGQLVQLRFVADLSATKLGEAHVFHLTQTGPAGPQGGLTVVMLPI